MTGDSSQGPEIPSTSSPWFATTQWGVVVDAGHADTVARTTALEQLCQTYWYPLYAYTRRRGYTKHDAQDLTQGFFAHLLHGGGLRNVAPGRGKFRSFLLTSLNHFLADEHDRQQAQKRGGGQSIISFDAQEAEQRYQLEPSDSETPEKLFERRWAVTLTDEALARLEQEFVAAGKKTIFEQLHVFLIEGTGARPYAEVAHQLGMTEEAVKKTVQRLRHRYQEVLRKEIERTVPTVGEIEEEMRYLRSVLGS